jgi:DNA-binding SARP family transcriptional activator
MDRQADSRQYPIRITLLGPPRIECAGVRVDARLSSQSLLVLAMLVTRADVVRRDELAFTLWPDATESEALGTLRRHIYRLQQAVPAGAEPWLACDAKTVRWARTDDTWFDVAEFERLSAHPDTHDAALALYAGDFAPYHDHEWARDYRERLRRRAIATLEDSIARQLARCDIFAARRYVEALLVHDPWREDAVRQLLQLRCRLSDRAGALAFYRGFEARLRDEFGVEPMPETMRCHAAVVRGEIDTDFSRVELERLRV